MSHHYDAATALVVVDVQNDFADPGGSLYVQDGEAVVAPLNDEIAAARGAGATVVLTQDWHPVDSPHFTDGGGTWPRHCVRGTWGAAFHRELNTDADLLLRKGTDGEDGYSAFTVVDPGTAARSATGLAAYLDARGVTSVVIGGLAADVCVKATAIDAHDAGFVTTVLWSMTRAVDIEPGDGDRARAALADIGVTVAD